MFPPQETDGCNSYTFSPNRFRWQDIWAVNFGLYAAVGEFNRISSQFSWDFVVSSSFTTPIRTIESNSFLESSFAIFKNFFKIYLSNKRFHLPRILYD